MTIIVTIRSTEPPRVCRTRLFGIVNSLPTYEANHAHVLSADVIAEDETWWRLMKKGCASARRPDRPW